MGRKRIKKAKASFTLREIFLSYPFKDKEDLFRNDGQYYFPNDQIISDHNFSLTYKQFNSIASALLEEIKIYLLSGKVIKLPKTLGTISFKKIKLKKKVIDWKLTNELYGDHNKISDDKKRVYIKNRHSGGFTAMLIWDKGRFKNKSFIKFSMAKVWKKSLAQAMYSDTSIIYNFLRV